MSIKCDYCGRFVSFEDGEARGYIPYGGPTDLQPPDEVVVCGGCWSRKTPDQIALTESISWRGPYRMFSGGG